MTPEQIAAPIAEPRAVADLDAGFILATVEVRAIPSASSTEAAQA
jgi:hypothetical protein